MPTYEYECPNCGVFEIFHSMKGRKRKCPECGERIKKLIGSGSGIIFKGSGFYETDYKRKDTQKEKDRKNAQKEKDRKEGE